MRPDTDLIILGGGCAGLSLAMKLAELGNRSPQTLILESRKAYDNDRTWCFWGDDTTELSHLVGQSWKRVLVKTEKRRAVLDCGDSPYQMIESGVFYDEAMKVISGAERIQLKLGVPVTELQKKDGLWRIETTGGTHTARMVIDTRPSSKSTRDTAILWQSFLGREVECEESRFDPGTVDLMDFAVCDQGQIAFCYVLPFTHTRALVEATVFTTQPLGPRDLTQALEGYIAKHIRGSAFVVRRSESGILPMGLSKQPSSPDPTYARAGLAAGGGRASTGYAFQRIQRWARACAKKIGEGSPPIGHVPDPILAQAMDDLFLRVLRLRPESAPEIFLALFEKTSPARLIRFLSDRGTLADHAAIAAALLRMSFLKALPAALMSRQLPMENELRRS